MTTNFFIIRAPAHPLMKFLLEVATVNIEQRSFDNTWQATGPSIPTALYGIQVFGSADAYKRALIDAHPNPQWRLRLVDIIVGMGGTADLLAGVQFSPIESRQSVVTGKSMPYQQGKRHWEGRVYREAMPSSRDTAGNGTRCV